MSVPPAPRPAPDAGRDPALLASLGLALCLALGSWWPVLSAGGPLLPELPVAAARSVPLDLNTADAAALERLPGVGEALARRIVDHRKAHGPFASPEDLSGVPGLGMKRLDRIRPLVRAGAGS